MIPIAETVFSQLLVVALAAYLIGSVPFGMILAKFMGLGNLRDVGSGNIGATNVLRTGSKSAAVLTLIFDAGKGACAVILARKIFGEDAAQLAGIAAFIGHCYPVWLRFQGGKGVATFLGVLFALFWPAGIATCLVWLTTATITRISSLSALISSASSVLWVWILGMPNACLVVLILAILIWWRHSANITRILDGTETKIGK